MMTEQKSERDTIRLLGVHIDILDTAGLCERIFEFLNTGKTYTVMYVNADCMLIAQKDLHYREVLNTCDLVYADGIGVVYGARLWGHQIPGRSTAADFMPEFCKSFAQKGVRLYFLGAPQGVAEKAAEKLCRQIPNLQIVGTQHGYFSPEQEQTVIQNINEADPDIVVVGFGAPKQELWIDNNKDKLNAKVIWGVGGLFDFLSEETRRGPQWLLDHGFEWLCRLITEPGRLWKRYLIGNTKFIAVLLWHRFFKREAVQP